MKRCVTTRLATSLIVALSSCSLIQPDTRYSELATQQRLAISAWQPQAQTQNASLNQLIASPPLNLLIAEALGANPSLQQTLLTLQIRQAEWRQEAGARLPSAELDLTGEKSEDTTTRYTGALIVSWQADLWQTLSDRSRAAGKDVEQQQRLYQAARDTLAANVIDAWLALINQQRAYAIQQKRIEALTSNEAFILQRYRNGLGTLNDLDSARGSLASARATLEAYRESLTQQRRALRNLLGRSQSEPMTIPDHYPPVTVPLATLPEQTLARRPDLQAAYAAIEAQSLRRRAAYNDLLPSISLQAALQNAATNPRDALLTDPLWSLLGKLTAPLYQGGQLRAAADIAELEAAQAYQTYRDTLLTAVTEVENTLGQEHSLGLRQQHIEVALTSARNNLLQYRSSYRSGLVDILDLLTIEQQTYDLESQLNDLIYQRLSNRVSLGLALGLGVDDLGVDL